LALELLFEFGVGVGPEAAEAFGDLDGAVVGGQDVEGEGEAALGDFEIVVDAVEILDAGAEEGFGVGGVGDFCAASAGEFEAVGRVLIDEALLGRGEEGAGEGEDREIFDVAVANGLVAGEEDDVVAFVGPEVWDILLGEDAGEEVDAFDPLFDGVVPAVETEFVVEDALGEDGGGRGAGFGIAILSVEHEVAEHF